MVAILSPFNGLVLNRYTQMKLCNSFVCLTFVLAVKSVLSSVELPSTVLLNQSIDVNIHPKRWTKKWKERNVRKYYVTTRGSDGEFIDASNHFFWNKTDGIAMELGAVDGKFDDEQCLSVYATWSQHT